MEPAKELVLAIRITHTPTTSSVTALTLLTSGLCLERKCSELSCWEAELEIVVCGSILSFSKFRFANARMLNGLHNPPSRPLARHLKHG